MCVERNPLSWSVRPKIERVRFAVVPDAITESLELEKGSGDVAVNSLPMDSLPVLASAAKPGNRRRRERRFSISTSICAIRC
jgi:ABC-type transport system substrate-binding protein